MEIKMCRFQRSDCFEWLQFVLEAALTPARLCEAQSRGKPGEMIQQHGMNPGWLTGHCSICCYCTAAEIQKGQIRHKNVSCVQDRAGRERNQWCVRKPTGFSFLWGGMELEALSPQGNAAHTGETCCCQVGGGTMAFLRHHGFSGVLIIPKIGLHLEIKMSSTPPTEKSYHSHIVHAFYYNSHTLKT